jgi:hypothetical protein
MSDKKALAELDEMLRALKARRKTFFNYGRFSCSRKLANGARVRFSVAMPPVKKSTKKAAKPG